jgi:hypothetical protein
MILAAAVNRLSGTAFRIMSGAPSVVAFATATHSDVVTFSCHVLCLCHRDSRMFCAPETPAFGCDGYLGKDENHKGPRSNAYASCIPACNRRCLAVWQQRPRTDPSQPTSLYCVRPLPPMTQTLPGKGGNRMVPPGNVPFWGSLKQVTIGLHPYQLFRLTEKLRGSIHAQTKRTPE